MANIKISELPGLSSVDVNAIVPVVQNGTTYYATVDTINKQTSIYVSTAGDTYIQQGGVVKLGTNGYGYSVVANYNYTPTQTSYAASNGGTNMTSLMNERTVSCPEDPTRVATAYISSGSLYVKYGRYTDGTMVYDSTYSIANLGSNSGAIDIDWNPFNVNELIVTAVDTSSGTLYAYIITVDSTKIVTAYPNSIYLTGSVNSMFAAFKYSKTTASQIVAAYAQSSGGQYLVAQVFTLSFNGISWNAMGGGEYILDTVNPYSPYSSQVVLDTLASTDRFGISYHYWGGSSYVNRSVIFNKTGTGFSVGTPYESIDGIIYPNATTIAFKFISESMFINCFNNSGYISVSQGSYIDNNIYSAGYPSSANDTTNGYIGLYSTSNKSIFATLYLYNSNEIKVQFYYMNSGYLSMLGTSSLFMSSQYPDYVPLGSFYPAATFITYKDGIGDFLITFQGNNMFYSKGFKFVFLNKQFNNNNLLGVAQTAGGYGQTITVVPFGEINAINTLPSGLIPGTMYYIQDDGSISSVPSGSKYGLALDYITVKTAYYPTN